MQQTSHLSQFDKMTKTPIPNLIIRLSIPTIISTMVTNIYNMVDTAFVGRLGTSASGAIGIVFGFMAILQAIGFMFGQGAGSIMARNLGKQDQEQATITASTGFFGALLCSILTEIICFICLDSLVYALGSTTTIAPYAKTYIFYILLSAPFMVTSFTLNNVLRYEGKAFLGMIGLLTGAVLNMIGDPIFMFGFDMGIAGAGLSTALSQIISFLILLSMFLRGKTQTKITYRKIHFKPSRILDICGTGLPSLLRQGLNSITTVLLNSCASVYGDAAVAAMSIVSRIVFFVFSVALGIGQGFQPVSAFNYGAKRYDRVRKAYRFTILLSELLIVILAVFVIWKSPVKIRLFRDDDKVVEIGTRALRLQCLSELLLPFCMVTEMTMQSTGQKLAASLLSSLRSGLIFIPSLLILAHFRGIAGIQEAQPLSFMITVVPTIMFALHFFRKMPKEKG